MEIGMEKRREERIQKLIQLLKEVDKLHLRDAAQALNVSEMTIRRDLSAGSSVLILLGGYIVSDPKMVNVNNYFVDEQKFKNVEEKRYIGQLAARLVAENEVVFFDSGTTVPFIIEHIPDDLPFTGVCYSLNTFLALQEKPHCKVILCGGEFKTSSYIFTTVGGHNELDFIHPNKAFISAAGLSLDQGVTTFILDEVKLKMQAMAASQNAILVADRYKFDQVRVGKFGELSSFKQLVTDSMPEKKYRRYFASQKIEIIC
jgi:DeoR family deoxyribose operon repressor